MKILLKNFTLLTLLIGSSSIYAIQGLNVITITTDDPQGYVEWLSESHLFSKKHKEIILPRKAYVLLRLE